MIRNRNNMKTPQYLLLLLLISLGWACADNGGNDDPQPQVTNLEMRFRPVYGEEALVMFQPLEYEAGMDVLVQVFQLYLAPVSLIRSDGSELVLRDVTLLDFRDFQDAAMAEAGLTLSFEDVPAGTYSGIRLGLGLPPELNATSPAQYEPGHPLSDNYWTAATGYIFSKVEGIADTTGSGNFNTPLTFHTGSDDIYQTVTFDRRVEVDAQNLQRLNFSVDLRKVLVRDNGDFLDFRTYTIDHHTNSEVYEFIGANLLTCIELQP